MKQIEFSLSGKRLHAGTLLKVMALDGQFYRRTDARIVQFD